MTNSQNRGLTAPPAYTPFGVVTRAFRQIRHQNLMELRSRIWAGVLVLAALGTGIALVEGGYDFGPLWALLILASVAAAAERQTVALTERMEMSVSFLPVVFAAIAFGPFAAFVAGALAHATDLRRPPLRWLVYTQVRAVCGAVAGLAVSAVAVEGGGFGAFLLASLAASVAYLAADAFFNAATLVVRGGDLLALVRTVVPLFLLAVPLYVPLVALFVYGYHVYSLWIVVAFFIPALAVQKLIHLYQEERDATRRLMSANQRLEIANVSFATALVATIDARDRYTAGHSAAVAVYARDIAARLGLDDTQQRLAHLCGLVHDVGKVGLAAGLLEKPGALTLEERRQMEQHPVIGERILRNVDNYGEIAAIVRHHHERVDGLGYPDCLSGDDIPLLSRVIAVADAYNAMTSDRPYRDAMPSRVARLRLAQAVESQFDTTVVAAFEAVLAGSTESYRSGQREDFSLEVNEAARRAALLVATA